MPEHIPDGTCAYRVRRNEHATGKPNPNYVRRKLPVFKVDVATVPAVFNADMVSRTGRTVWAGFDDERVVCVAATADEARDKLRTFVARKGEREAREKREQGSSENLEG